MSLICYQGKCVLKLCNCTVNKIFQNLVFASGGGCPFFTKSLQYYKLILHTLLEKPDSKPKIISYIYFKSCELQYTYYSPHLQNSRSFINRIVKNPVRMFPCGKPHVYLIAQSFFLAIQPVVERCAISGAGCWW